MPNDLAARLALFVALLAAGCSATAHAPSPGVRAAAAGPVWVAPPEPSQPSAAPPTHAFAAQQSEAGDPQEVHESAELHDGEPAAGHAEGEHAVKHEHAERGTHVADIFLGGTDELRDRDGYTVGLDYGYHIAENWGVGAFAEFVSGSRRSFAGGVMAFYHPVEPWIIGTGPGLERSEEEWEPIWRLVTSWEIHIHEGLFIAPTLAYDWNTHDGIVVYGLSVGIVR